MRLPLAATLILLAIPAGADETTLSPRYTLYRDLNIGAGMRVHMASFDAEQRGDYNEKQCWTIAKLLTEHQTDGAIHYWCERGAYRP